MENTITIQRNSENYPNHQEEIQCCLGRGKRDWIVKNKDAKCINKAIVTYVSNKMIGKNIAEEHKQT